MIGSQSDIVTIIKVDCLSSFHLMRLQLARKQIKNWNDNKLNLRLSQDIWNISIIFYIYPFNVKVGRILSWILCATNIPFLFCFLSDYLGTLDIKMLKTCQILSVSLRSIVFSTTHKYKEACWRAMLVFTNREFEPQWLSHY